MGGKGRGRGEGEEKLLNNPQLNNFHAKKPPEVFPTGPSEMLKTSGGFLSKRRARGGGPYELGESNRYCYTSLGEHFSRMYRAARSVTYRIGDSNR